MEENNDGKLENCQTGKCEKWPRKVTYQREGIHRPQNTKNDTKQKILW